MRPGPLMTQSGHGPLRIAASQNDRLDPISPVANPCCNCVPFGVVPALVKAMRRRDFIKVIAGSAAAWPLAARAQQPRRVGVLMPLYSQIDREGQASIAAFLDTFRRLGWTDGRNVRIEYRWTAGDAERQKTAAEEL